MHVLAGEHHSLIMDENGGVWAMGSNREGQVGLQISIFNLNK